MVHDLRLILVDINVHNYGSVMNDPDDIAKATDDLWSVFHCWMFHCIVGLPRLHGLWIYGVTT